MSGSLVSRAFPLLAMALVWFPRIALAAPTADQESACPALESVEDAAGELLGRSRAGNNRLDEAIQVQDLGDRYLVRVKGSASTFVDEAHDCDARARAAAVFVALILSPTTAVSAAEPPRDQPPTPPATVSVSPAVSKTTRSWWPQIEVGALGAAAPRREESQVVFGGELRLVLTQARWGITLGGSLPTSSTITLGPQGATVLVRQSRYPFDLGPRVSWHAGWLFAAIDLGALAALSQLRRDDPVNVNAATNAPPASRVELGGRVAATLGLEGGTFIVFLRTFSEFVLVTHEIAVEPQGTIGETSAFWIGITVGVAGKFH